MAALREGRHVAPAQPAASAACLRRPREPAARGRRLVGVAAASARGALHHLWRAGNFARFPV